jgi:NDP-sugar pyrophosphorylase family protein
MNKTLNVFILAAGLGERLRPITDYIPKPLLPILGKPVLQSILEKVSTLPVNKVGINLHYKKEIIEDWIKQSAFYEKITLFPEEIALDTGGALKNAEAFLNSSIFLVHNSDILSDIDLTKLLETHLSSKNLATLAVHDFPEFNDLAIDEKGFLKKVGRTHGLQSEGIKCLAFTGIAVYSPEFLKFIPQGPSSVVDAWLKAISAGYEIGTLDVSGCYWSDIGTPSAYSSTVINALKAEGEMIYIHPSVEGCKYIDLDGYVVIEKESILEKGISLRNCIMLPGSYAERNSYLENCIIGPGFKIGLKEAKMLGEKDDALLIGTGGSDRKYYRIKKGRKSAVLMQCINSDPNFERQIEYSRFFLKHSVPVPELIKVKLDKKRAIFEDLGDISLYSWLRCPREQEEIEEIYKKVIDVLILIHTVATEHVAKCPLLQKTVFDYNHLRWETEYFIKRFVMGIRNIKIKNLSVLNEEFHRLALKVDSFPKTVIHRDFQSQNIIITKRLTPRIIDYQGARMGPPAYDVVSILWDPYYRLKDDLRERLLNYYISEMRNKKGGKFSEKDFRDSLLPCRLQRHMQALGAYGFLSTIKGKDYFLKYVPEGLRLLKEDILLSKNEYPKLYEFIMGL